MATEFVIMDRATSGRLRTDRTLKRTIRRIRLGADLDLPDAGPLEHRINRTYFACGCGSGAAAVYLALLGIGLSWWTMPDLMSWNLWNGALAVLTAGAVGKIVGLLSARRSLARALDRIEAAL